jgi:hypothetical protein
VDYYAPRARAYTSRAEAGGTAKQASAPTENGHEGPGFFEKLSHTPAFGRVKDEASNIGDAVLKELGKTVTGIVLPALMTSIRGFIGDHLPKAESTSSTTTNSETSSLRTSNYQPTLDHGRR